MICFCIFAFSFQSQIQEGRGETDWRHHRMFIVQCTLLPMLPFQVNQAMELSSGARNLWP